jgi:hypothetical protein
MWTVRRWVDRFGLAVVNILQRDTHFMQPEPVGLPQRTGRIARLRLRRLWRTALVAAAALIVVLSGLALLRREQIAFAARCWGNGNALPSCVCVYNALDELPGNYRALAVSWAHDSGTAYAAGVMRLIAAEAWRVSAARIERLVSIGDRKEAISTWVWKTADAVGWMALKQAAPTVAAGLAPVVAALPIIDDAAGEYNKAEAAIARHCWAPKTFVGRIYDTRLAAAERLEALTTVTLEVAKDAAKSTGKATAETGATTTVRVWTWVRSWF